MARTPLCIVAVVFLALTVSYAHAGIAAGDAKSIASGFESRYRHARTLRADFLERYSDGSGAVTVESGTVYFSRHGRMRWEYESPEEKLFLVDGKNAWFYVPADRVVSRAKIKESSDWRTPLALLAGSANLASVCQSLSVVDAAAVPAGARGRTGFLRRRGKRIALPAQRGSRFRGFPENRFQFLGRAPINSRAGKNRNGISVRKLGKGYCNSAGEISIPAAARHIGGRRIRARGDHTLSGDFAAWS